MKRDNVLCRTILTFIGLVFFFSPCITMTQTSEKEKAATAAAENWLGLVDGGKYAETWTEAAGYFKNAVTQDQWVQSLKAVRTPLGRIISVRLRANRM